MKQPYYPSSESTTTNANSTRQQGVIVGVSADGESFTRLVQFLKKRGWIIAIALILGVAAGVIANTVMQRQYTALAQIEVLPDQSSQFRLEQVQDLAGGDEAQKIDTEISILESRSLALETVRSLHLDSNPDFLPLPNGRPWDMSVPAVREELADAFLGSMRIERLGHTSIIQIFVTSSKPALATLIANTLIDNYIQHSFRDSYASTAKISGWLSGQLDGLRGNLEKSQGQIAKLQQDLGYIGLDPKDSVDATNLEELNKQVADAEVNRLVKEARLQALQNSQAVVDSNSPESVALQASRQSMAQLQAEYASLSQTYGPAYPRLQSLKAQMDQVQKNIKQDEQAQIVRAKAELDAARNTESMLRSSLDAAQQKAFGKDEKGAQFEFARRDYEANRILYDGLQERLQEAGILAGLHSTAIHIVDNADIPPYPSSPRKHTNLAIGTGVGLMLGLGLALLLEALDTNLKTMTEIEQALQLPLLAAIPSVQTDELLPAKFREVAITKGAAAWSRIAEALRGMRTSILLSSPGAPPKVIMVTSTRPAEGKSSVATLTAITFALNGSRVLLIDADLRRPSVHLRFRIGKGQGLSSVLSGESSMPEAIVAWKDLPNLHVLPSGPIPPLPSELLGSKQMEEALAGLRDQYDFIIIDTPPVLAVTDASVLGRLTDATILILRYGSAQRHVAQRCVDVLDRSGALILGVAVNAVDFKAPEYSEYYGRKYNEYYGERNPE